MEMDSILENRKNYQRNKMLSVIRLHENISRNDVKKITAYSMTTVLSTIDELIQEGLVYEESCNDSRVGRKPVWLRINPEGGYFLGVEFNRNAIHCVALDFTGKLIYDAERNIETSEKTADQVLNRNRYSGIQRCEQGNCNFVQSSERLEEYSCKRYSRKGISCYVLYG